MSQLLKQGLWLLPIGITFTDCIASVIKVEGGSMRPTLNADSSSPSDWVLVEKLSIKLQRQYTRGEVVVLWAPDNPHQQIIKRLLAIEGDTIIDDPKTQSWVEVPQGRCWIEGDNTAMSGDSKTAFGPVHLGLLEGRVTHIVWPPERMGRVAVQPQPGRLLQMDKKHGLVLAHLYTSECKPLQPPPRLLPGSCSQQSLQQQQSAAAAQPAVAARCNSNVRTAASELRFAARCCSAAKSACAHARHAPVKHRSSCLVSQHGSRWMCCTHGHCCRSSQQ